MHTAYITHSLCLKHQINVYHPESPARMQAIQDALIAEGLLDCMLSHEAIAATDEQLQRVHDADYVHSIERVSPSTGVVYLDSDTALNPFSHQAARLAAGAVVMAVDVVMSGEAQNAFCNIRPPGHHAERAQAMGFCIFNNVAVGVAHALAHYGLQRVAIVDFDVHHGNGTEQIFAEDPRVLLCSSFQHPFYPHMGADSQAENILNLPLKAGTAGQGFREAFEQYALPRLREFQPQFIFISAGFDAHRDDEMAGLNLLEADYIWITQQLKQIATEYADDRIVSVLEGGYDLPSLARSVVGHVSVLLA